MLALRGRVHGRPEFTVEVELERFGPAERRRRALRLALPLAGLGLLVLPVPGLHLSSPVLFGCALWLGGRRLREAERIRGLVGRCECGAGEQRYALPDRVELPLTVRCPGCREFVRVQPA